MRLTLNVEDITLGDLRAFLSLASGMPDETEVIHCGDDPEGYFPDSLSVEIRTDEKLIAATDGSNG